ncbi:hypothetical protein OURE66S_03861 [Oligella ureolytica]
MILQENLFDETGNFKGTHWVETYRNRWEVVKEIEPVNLAAEAKLPLKEVNNDKLNRLFGRRRSSKNSITKSNADNC